MSEVRFTQEEADAMLMREPMHGTSTETASLLRLLIREVRGLRSDLRPYRASAPKPPGAE